MGIQVEVYATCLMSQNHFRTPGHVYKPTLLANCTVPLWILSLHSC